MKQILITIITVIIASFIFGYNTFNVNNQSIANTSRNDNHHGIKQT